MATPAVQVTAEQPPGNWHVDEATKSAHLHSPFAPIAAEIMCVSAAGTGAMDMRALAYRRVSQPLRPPVADRHA
jgi:microcystin degradation protein MlrC